MIISLPGPTMVRCLFLVVCVIGLALIGRVGGQQKQDPKKAPQINVLTPLGVTVGTTTKLTLRGLRLDTADEVRCKEPGVTVKVLNKSKVGVPNQQDPNVLGDTQIEVEIKIPSDFKSNTGHLVVRTPQGESQEHRLLVDGKPVLHEKEPNDSFRQAQLILIPQVVEGRISQPMDVDVFQIEGKQGQQMILETHAARYGSPLDSILTLYSGEGQVIGTCDDIDGSTDSRLEVVLPKTGRYFITVIDAHDQGGPTHVYRLSVRVK